MSGSVRSRMPLRLLLSSITGWRTTTPCIPIPGWAIAHLGSTSFPNPLRVRFDGVNSTALHDEMMRFVQVNRLELDELWSYVGKKQRKVKQTGVDPIKPDTQRVGKGCTPGVSDSPAGNGDARCCSPPSSHR